MGRIWLEEDRGRNSEERRRNSEEKATVSGGWREKEEQSVRRLTEESRVCAVGESS